MLEAGDSMVVLTEYDFDADAWRATAKGGPEVAGVELGTAGTAQAWERLPLDDGVPVTVRRRRPRGRPARHLAGARRKPFTLGDVRFEWLRAAASGADRALVALRHLDPSSAATSNQRASLCSALRRSGSRVIGAQLAVVDDDTTVPSAPSGR